MATYSRGPRILSLVATFAALVCAFLWIVRPWYLQWGAAEDDVRRPLPGDEIIAYGGHQETRVITIDASTDRVWPWIAQLGQDRAGFYSFDLLENLVGCEMPTTDALRPDKQSWKIGDRLWMYPAGKAGGRGFATLRTFVPGRVLGFGAHAVGTATTAPEDGSWSFVLEPIDRSTTRLIVRGRGAAGRTLLGVAFDRTIFEPVHFVMERRMMVGIKQLAEGSDRQRLANHVHVMLWTITLSLFIAALVLVLRRESWGRALAAFGAAGIVFQILTFVQPPIVVGIALVVAVAAILWPPRTGAVMMHPAVVGHRA